MDLVTVRGNFSISWISIRWTHVTQQPHTIHKAMDSQKLWWASPRSWWTNLWKKENRGTLVFLQYRTTPISSTLPSPLEMLTGKKTTSEPSQVPSSIGHNMDTSRIHKELLRRQPTTSTSTGATELEPGQPLFVKEVHGNVWRTATIDQPAAEPGFLLGQVSRQLHLEKDQINDQTKVFTFSFWASGQKHSRGTLKEKPVHVLIHPSTSWMDSQCCLSHLWQVWPTPATIDRDSQVGAPDPITGATSPTGDRGATPSPQMTTTPRRSTRSTKGVPPVCYNPIQKVIDDVLVTFRVCKLCSGVSVSFSQYGLVKHEHCGFLTFSAIPNCVSDT